jgi:hypothetical protein
MQSPKPIYSYVSAAALAVVTLFTFYVYRDFGPQSVIRRFHIDAVREDFTDIDALTTMNSSSHYTRDLISFVQRGALQNASFEIVGIKRRKKDVLAEVQYTTPQAGIGVLWHVIQTPTDWRIDAVATWNEIYNREPRVPN